MNPDYNRGCKTGFRIGIGTARHIVRSLFDEESYKVLSERWNTHVSSLSRDEWLDHILAGTTLDDNVEDVYLLYDYLTSEQPNQTELR